MKICLPTMGNNGLEEKVHNHFGSAAYFVVYNTESKEMNVIKNVNEHHSHGNCHPLKAIEGHEVEAILTGGMGKRAVTLMNNAGIKIYRLEGDTVQDAITRFESEQLTEIDANSACGGHDCH